MLRVEFRNELLELHKELLKMGTVIEGTIDMLIEAFKAGDKERLNSVIARDDIIDEYEFSLEKKCLNLILRQQPVAEDLRTVASVLKIITDMERIADHCTDIAEYTKDIIDENNGIFRFDTTDIFNMMVSVKDMISGTIDCYVNRDARRALEIALTDDAVDEYFEIIAQSIAARMSEDSNCIRQGVSLLYIVKYLERMADHATNICEWIAYRVTGEHKQYN